MRRPIALLAAFALLSLAACARHVVVKRDVGRIDAERSISTSSDTDWRVSREPAAR